MGEAKWRADARAHAYANGLPWHVEQTCPACSSKDVQIVAREDMPPLVGAHFTSSMGLCLKCRAIWEPFPPVMVEDPVCSEPCDNCAFRPGSPEQRDTVAWREMLERLAPGPAGVFHEKFYCHKGVPIDMTKGPGNFLFPQKPVTSDGEVLRQPGGDPVMAYDTSKMRVCSGYLRMFWAKMAKQERAHAADEDRLLTMDELDLLWRPHTASDRPSLARKMAQRGYLTCVQGDYFVTDAGRRIRSEAYP